MTFRLPAETFTLSLSLGGRFAGQQHWSIQPERSAYQVRVQTDFAGALPPVRRVQLSRLHLRTLSSLHYAEGDGRGRPSFETTFDRRSGLISLRQGREEAWGPLVADTHDPVSLLLWLRAHAGLEQATQPLTGGKVYLQRLPDEVCLGQPAWVYYLRPGQAYVYIEQSPERRLLRLIQPTDFGAVEASWGQGAAPHRSPERGRRRR